MSFVSRVKAGHMMAGLFSFACLLPNFGFAASLSIPSPTAEFPVGAAISLNLIGKDFEISTIGGGVNLDFDPSVVRLENVTFTDSVFDFEKKAGTVDNAKGHAENILVSSITKEHSGTFIVATFNFTAVGGGTSTLALSSATFPTPWVDIGGDDLRPSFINGSLTVQAVPLPLPIVLFGSGLGLFAAYARRRPS